MLISPAYTYLHLSGNVYRLGCDLMLVSILRLQSCGMTGERLGMVDAILIVVAVNLIL